LNHVRGDELNYWGRADTVAGGWRTGEKNRVKNLHKVCVTAVVMFILTACVGRGLQHSSNEVRLLIAEPSGDCENVGATHVSVGGRRAHPDWSPDRIASELQNLARNGAIQLGGNAILPMTGIIDGTQSFTVFRCGYSSYWREPFSVVNKLADIS